ncbi:unnamed protein product [Cuscuta epithymum]|uniref:Uncharacterized protein n=1 Tax=Cuscuta epithymum TaxID=186058 RepID=A0AAV0D7J9_9ASTE|nr:unnamed protein product [Cuscuta epithymum]
MYIDYTYYILHLDVCRKLSFLFTQTIKIDHTDNYCMWNAQLLFVW